MKENRYSYKEIESLSYRDLISKNEISSSHDIINSVLQGNVPPLYEKTMVKKDGSELPVEINLSLIMDDVGERELIQSVVRDISARKKSMKELERLTFFKNAVFRILNKTFSGNRIIPPLPACRQAGRNFSISPFRSSKMQKEAGFLQ